VGGKEIPGQEYTFVNTSGVKAKMRVYINKQHVYIIRVTWRGKLPEHEIDNNFLNSLFITSPVQMPIDVPGQQFTPGMPANLQRVFSPKEISVNDLILHYDFEEFDANMVFDRSGKELHASLFGGKRIAGLNNGRAIFLEPNSYIDFSNNNNKFSNRLNFNAHQSFTLACWVATKANSGVIVSLRSQNDKRNSPQFNVLVDVGKLAVKARSDGKDWDQAFVNANRAINDGNWHHIAVVRLSDGRVQLYQDGDLVGTWVVGGGVTDGSFTTDARALGCDLHELFNNNQGLVGYFNGALDEFCVFSRALNNVEIQKLAGRGGW
jgi:hypothetical protein